MNSDHHTESAGPSAWLPHRHDRSTPRLTNAVRSRPVRRMLVIASAALLAIAVVLVWFQSGDPATGSQVAYLVAGGLAIGGFTLVNMALRAHRAGADERLASIRDEAYRIAYVTLAIVTGAAIFGISLAWQNEWAGFTLEPNHLRALLLGFLAAAVWLPAGVIAWREVEI